MDPLDVYPSTTSHGVQASQHRFARDASPTSQHPKPQKRRVRAGATAAAAPSNLRKPAEKLETLLSSLLGPYEKV